MHDTRLSIIKFAIYLAMLLGLLLMLPEEPAATKKLVKTGYPTLDNVRQAIAPPHSRPITETAAMSRSIRL